MSIYCKHLSLDFDPLRDMSYLDRFTHEKYGVYSIPKEEVSDKMKQFFDEIAVVDWECEVFVNPENYVMPIHTDGVMGGDYAKINFVYCDDEEHSMDWYEVLPSWYDRTDKIAHSGTNAYGITTPVDNDYQYFREEDTVRKHTTRVKVAMINASIPHNIRTKSKRKTVSFVPQVRMNRKLEEMTMFNNLRIEKYVCG